MRQISSSPWRLFGVVATCATFVSAAQAQIDFPTFSSSTGLSLVGNMNVTSGVLKSASNGPFAGAAWSTSKLPVAGGFDTTFTFKYTPVNGHALCDGFAFVIQNSSGSYLGEPGRSLGYGGLANSIAIEFDTQGDRQFSYPYTVFDPITPFWWRTILDPTTESGLAFVLEENVDGLPNNNDIAIQCGGVDGVTSSDNLSDDNLGIGYPATPLMAGTHTARIKYDAAAKLVQVFIDGDVSPVVATSVDLATAVALDGGKAYVGFTTPVRPFTCDIDFLSWKFQGSRPVSWSGLLQPVSAGKTYKAGSTLPLKFTLTGADADRADLNSTALVDGVPMGAFTYDPSSREYRFNLSTKGLTAGSHTLSIDLGDGFSHPVNIDLR